MRLGSMTHLPVPLPLLLQNVLHETNEQSVIFDSDICGFATFVDPLTLGNHGEMSDKP